MEHKPHTDPLWSRAKLIRQKHGLSAPQLKRYAQDGLIRTSNIRRPGQVRGVRLYSLSDILRLIAESVEAPKESATKSDPAA